ncbi:alanine/ornithine racemase family PLP-dependent enzyme [Saliterribacillus persicus]|uniref:Putative amino acid racemase n=1 Tax=Saliterribacillus persicus TaxID=930114 RepID=A0A368Y9R4_9BACI|nr:alanine/ornithine racemase family PLP-dependent enzyme [Saliterribacillus persicus]RCW76855.1 putative amino acid racemase [Saliterribacillus persicus]
MSNTLQTPRINIDLKKIAHNALKIKALYQDKGIEVMGVVKGVCASPAIAQTLINSGITHLADSKIVNLRKMKEAGVEATFILLRTPSFSQVEDVITYADISFNTEISVIRKLSEEAISRNQKQKIMLMIEMGDLREGIMPEDLATFIPEVLSLSGIELIGMGTNYACFGGVIPTEAKMQEFSALVAHTQQTFSLQFSLVSGGNSANFWWISNTDNPGLVNNIRIGESILLGRETIHRQKIPDLYTDAFTFTSEIIELKTKPSYPNGEMSQNAFGETPIFKDIGRIRRAILSVGRQDILVDELMPIEAIEILGASSDHIVLDVKQEILAVGDEVSFFLNYGALLMAMTSPYVYKNYLVN